MSKLPRGFDPIIADNSREQNYVYSSQLREDRLKNLYASVRSVCPLIMFTASLLLLCYMMITRF